MKKLMLSALLIVGLTGSSAQGAAAMAAKFGAKAWSFAQASAVPVTMASMGYELGKMFGSSSKVAEQAALLNDNFAKYILPLCTNPRLLKLAGIKSQNEPSTWYGKIWSGIEYGDGLTDTLVSKIQKIMLLSSIFGGIFGVQKAYAQEPANMTPANLAQQSTQNQTPENSQPIIKLHRKSSGYRRSGIAAR